jgi:hypothetical protein
MSQILSPLQEKLQNFITHRNVPHLLFYGASGSGKKTLVNWFIKTLYKDKETIKEYVMYVNCGHCKGIQFVRGDLKFFSKTNININGHGGNFFKSVVLLNADKLTIDAQSAMRRCIEIFSHNTRFFIVVDDKCKILKPILSRLCEIYLPSTHSHINGEPTHMSVFPKQTHHHISLQTERINILKNIILNIDKELPEYTMFDVSKELYEKAFTGIELINLIEKEYSAFGISIDSMVELLFTFNKIKREIKNESMVIFVILYTIFYDPSACSRFIHAST